MAGCLGRWTFRILAVALYSVILLLAPQAAPAQEDAKPAVTVSQQKGPPPGHRPGPPSRSEGKPKEEPPGEKPGEKPAADRDGKSEDEAKKDGDKEGGDKKNGDKKDGDKKDGDEKDGDENKDDASKAVTRPTEPLEPADPKELELKPDEEGKLRFSFHGQPWPGVLRWLANISDMSLDWQEMPGGYLNLVTRNSYTLDEARDLINRHLMTRGYTLIRQGEVLSVAKLDELDPGMLPRVKAEDLDKRDSHEFVKTSFKLESLLAGNAVEELKPMLSPHGKLTALAATNRIEAIDAVTNLRQIYVVLSEEQSGNGQEHLVEVFNLEFARASEVQTQIQTLLGLPTSGTRSYSRGPSPEDMERFKRELVERMKQASREQGGKGGSGGSSRSQPAGKVSLVVDEKHNRILANAPPDKMAIIRQAVKALDVPMDRSAGLLANINKLQVYQLQTLDPDALINTLNTLGGLDPATRLQDGDDDNSIIVYAPLADHVTISALIAKLDGDGRKSEVIQLTTLRAEEVVKTIDFVMGGARKEEDSQSSGRRSYDSYDRYDRYSSSRRYGGSSQNSTDKFCVDADLRNNALLLWANDFELKKVNGLLENLRTVDRAKTDGTFTLETYRLAAIDPEPLVKTLKDIGDLNPRTTLEIDAENKAILAHGPPADHEKIRALIEKLDGSGREFHVIHLRRREADYVANTIQFMMVGKKEEDNSRGYDPYDYYGRYGRRGNEEEDASKGFRVDADLEHNQLLLWANEVEIQDVKKLLVQLGEITEEGTQGTIRVLDVQAGPESDEMLRRLREIWPSLAPNPLEIDIPKSPEPLPEQPPTQPSNSPTVKEDPAPETPSPEPENVTSRPPAELIRFAEYRVEDADAEDSPSAEPTAVPQPVEKTAQQPVEQPAVSAPPVADAGAAAETGEAPATEPTPPQGPPAAVRITRGSDGRLIITSQDPKALDRMERLMAELAPPRKNYKVFQLRYALAYWISYNLEDFFEEQDKQSGWSPWEPWGGRNSNSSQETRLSQRKTLKFISDSDTNTILVIGADPSQLATIEDLIKLYDQPQQEAQSARKTEIIYLQYTEAGAVAETVKEVYRDLLSANDKALSAGKEQQRQERSFVFNLGDGDTAQKQARWKGSLSVGIHQASNSLVISAPMYLFDDVTKHIKELDEAARPASTVRVVGAVPGVSTERMQRVLSEVFGGGVSTRRPSNNGPERRPQPQPSRPPGRPPERRGY